MVLYLENYPNKNYLTIFFSSLNTNLRSGQQQDSRVQPPNHEDICHDRRIARIYGCIDYEILAHGLDCTRCAAKLAQLDRWHPSSLWGGGAAVMSQQLEVEDVPTKSSHGNREWIYTEVGCSDSVCLLEQFLCNSIDFAQLFLSGCRSDSKL